jgi:hypothetical protein
VCRLLVGRVAVRWTTDGVTSRRDYPTSTPVTRMNAIIVVSFRDRVFFPGDPTTEEG